MDSRFKRSRIQARLILLVACLTFVILLFTTKQTRIIEDLQHSPVTLLQAESSIEKTLYITRDGWKDFMSTRDNFHMLNGDVPGEIENVYPKEVQFTFNQPKMCQDPPLALAIVITAPKNRERRSFIRGSWGFQELVHITGVRPVFLVGQTTDHHLQKLLEEEHFKHQDILQADFIDSYSNLTYKSTALLRWASLYCNNVPIILKIDDDVLPNPMALRDFLMSYLSANPKPTHILGKVRCCDPVLREGKWKVSEDVFPHKGYPPYVAGPSYLLPSAIIPRLLTAVTKTRWLWLEDVFVTGLAAQKANLSHHTILSLTNSLPNKINELWLSRARIFQENIGLHEATLAWDKLIISENLTYIFHPGEAN